MFTDLLKKLIIKVSNWFSCGLSVSKNHNISELWSRKTNLFWQHFGWNLWFWTSNIAKTQKTTSSIENSCSSNSFLSKNKVQFFIPDVWRVCSFRAYKEVP